MFSTDLSLIAPILSMLANVRANELHPDTEVEINESSGCFTPASFRPLYTLLIIIIACPRYRVFWLILLGKGNVLTYSNGIIRKRGFPTVIADDGE
ncbi:hypothetical protein BJ912DRAFT_994333 [Pholiota molesta]|nr:hypothetical protein BJ912DRAFT_994333 [Pholiota molesta]